MPDETSPCISYGVKYKDMDMDMVDPVLVEEEENNKIVKSNSHSAII